MKRRVNKDEKDGPGWEKPGTGISVLTWLMEK
jgi:hypothetical protein